MNRLLTCLLLCCALSSFAQRQNVYYLKFNGRYVDKLDSADYLRIVREPDSGTVLYNVLEYYKNGKPRLIGKSKTIDPPRFEGQCLRYYASGFKQSLTNYKNDNKSGPEYLFYPNGKSYTIKDYPANAGPENVFVDDYAITANYDSLGRQLVTDGNGYYRGYDEKFKYVEEEGKLKDGKRDSIWKIEFKNIHTSATENYENGKLITGTAVDEKGITTTYKIRSVSPQFKGGVAAFGRYLGNNIRYPDYERAHNIEGRVILSFVVEKDGSIKNIKVNKSVSTGLDEEAVRVLNKSPLWLPGTMMGTPVRVIYSVPINFALN